MSDTKSNDIFRTLQKLLSQPEWRLGEIVVLNGRNIRHEQDSGRNDLEVFTDPAAAREIALYDEKGDYRPLKGAPTLRRGWELRLRTGRDVLHALDYLYPAAIGLHTSSNAGRLPVTDLRQTLGRQSGMYRVTQKISDAAAQEVISDQCGIGSCLRKILWRMDESTGVTLSKPDAGANEVPYLCAEGCNLLVSAIRRRVKGKAE